MAAPITHIVLSEKVFDKYFKDKDKKEFITGIGMPESVAYEIYENIKIAEKEPKVIEYINRLYGRFEEILEKYSP